MALKSQAKPIAPGGPGIGPRWTRGAKVAVGTAYSTSSRVWYTLDSGCVTEVYYPTIDTPQIRDLQFLFTDGKSFFYDERRHLCAEVDCISETAIGFEVTSREKEARYTLHKTIIGHPHQNCLLSSCGWMKTAGKVRTTTFKSGHLLKRGGKSGCE